MPRHKKSTPSNSESRHDTHAAYAALMARLAAVEGAMTAQGRSRPTLEAPEETVRLVRALLTDLRRFAAGLGHKRAIPSLPHGPVKFSTLLLVLGEANARMETLGLEHGFPRSDPRSLKGRIDAANTDMATLLSSATARFRMLRQQRMDEEERETQWGG